MNDVRKEMYSIYMCASLCSNVHIHCVCTCDITYIHDPCTAQTVYSQLLEAPLGLLGPARLLVQNVQKSCCVSAESGATDLFALMGVM